MREYATYTDEPSTATRGSSSARCTGCAKTVDVHVTWFVDA
jgi:hypothetical protein